jgi:7-carboxy-7-deazaguanine synthase
MKLHVSEVFFSLNGEGLCIGVPTIFVRLSGCNLRCSWCDTEYAWEKRSEMTVKEIADAVETCDNGYCSWVLITGGEPLLQDIDVLVDTLHTAGYRIGVETNGTLYRDVLKKCDFISVDIKPPSSRNPTSDIPVFLKIVETIEKINGQVKVVIADENDYQFVRRFVEENSLAVPLVLQPCWGTMTYPQLCELYMKDPLPVKPIRILTQIHKIGDIK